jgi:hypothetical protein
MKPRSAGTQPNPAVDPVPFGHWTLRDEAAQCSTVPQLDAAR